MERRVKERLVGAAVLMAAAIILIPEMLSGPRRQERVVEVEHTTSDAPLKTYTIDLNRPPGTPVGESVDQAAPPPESAPAETTPLELQANPESAPAQLGSSQSSISSSEVGAPPKSRPSAESQRTVADPPVRSATTPEPTRTQLARVPATPPAVEQRNSIASEPNVPTSRGWAVQLGSFASRATADRMVKELASQGQRAFVMPVKSANGTLYRVRLGPFAERAAANDALSEVKGRVANAAIVAHP